MKRLPSIVVLLMMAAIALAQTEETAPDAAPTNRIDGVAATNMTEASEGTNLVTEGEGSTNLVTEAVEATNLIEAADAALIGLRDPFWPVGYEPAPPEPEVSEEEIEKAKVEEEIEKKIQWPVLQLKGITSVGTDRYMAIIAGIGLVESDQTISLRRGDMLYSWLIEEVTAKGVKITRLEARPYQLPTLGVRTQ